MSSHHHHHHNSYSSSSKKRTRRPNFLPAEVEKLVSALEHRRELVTGELGGVYKSQADLRKGWDEVTRAVNSIGRSMRTVAEIREKWMHLKCRTKKKASCGSATTTGNGGGGGSGLSGGGCVFKVGGGVGTSNGGGSGGSSGGCGGGADGSTVGSGGEGRSRDPQLAGGLVSPLEERILNLMWGCSVFDLPSGAHLNSPTHEQMPESSNLSASCTSEPPSFLKTEIIEEDSNNEFSPSFRDGKALSVSSSEVPLLVRQLEFARTGRKACTVSSSQDSFILQFQAAQDFHSFHQFVKKIQSENSLSAFGQRTDESSAMQYFQFYGYLSQQQNMMQDYIRTSTYQRSILANMQDFKDKVVLDVGAGSGILSFFAIQAGARKVYAVEASSMAQHAETLVFNNKCAGKIVVIYGKIEEIDLPEPVDVIISEPMGYMLFNERMLETYLHAKKWLAPNGKMFPTRGDLHIVPFTDDTLYMEQFSKANFWYQQAFHGVDLSSLRQAAMKEYFRQPVVDTFDIRICMAKSQRHVVDFLEGHESDLHRIEIPLEFELLCSGTVHGLAFWFDVAFIGSVQTIWLSTSPTEPLTHWYQVRCLLETPIFVKQGQILAGKVVLNSNKRQSYDVDIDLSVQGTGTKSSNTLDLKNPYFRYTGQAPQPPPGHNNTSPSESYWNQLDQMTKQTVTTVNGIMINGLDDLAIHQQQQNYGSLTNNAASPMMYNSNDNITQQRAAQARISASMAATSIGGGISPSLFTQIPMGHDDEGMMNHSLATISFNTNSSSGSPSTTSMSKSGSTHVYSPQQQQQQSQQVQQPTQQQHSVVMGNTSHYPVSNHFMIGDYVTPGNIMLPTQGLPQSFRQ